MRNTDPMVVSQCTKLSKVDAKLKRMLEGLEVVRVAGDSTSTVCPLCSEGARSLCQSCYFRQEPDNHSSRWNVIPAPTKPPTLREKTNHLVSAPPPPLPLPPSSPPAQPADTVLSSISDTQTESSNGALKDIRPGHSSREKEKADIEDGYDGDGHNRDGDPTAAGAIGTRDSSKRTAGRTGLNEGETDIPTSPKILRTGRRCIPRLMIPERLYRRHK